MRVVKMSIWYLSMDGLLRSKAQSYGDTLHRRDHALMDALGNTRLAVVDSVTHYNCAI